jgi:hypothetical protein
LEEPQRNLKHLFTANLLNGGLSFKSQELLLNNAVV